MENSHLERHITDPISGYLEQIKINDYMLRGILLTLQDNCVFL